MNVLDLILDIISPSWCVACESPVRRGERHLCSNCREEIRFVQDGCPVCSGEMIDGGCQICESRQIYFERNISVMEYDKIAKAMITGYKFGSRRRMAVLIADICFEQINELLEKADYVTAVPSSPKKKWKRGFNQSEAVARLIARRANLPYAELLQEIGDGKKQKSLGVSNRFLNVLGRYSLSRKGKSLAKGSVLIVDDVFTTGATINECARILSDSGFSPIFSATAARVGIKRLEK